MAKSKGSSWHSNAISKLCEAGVDLQPVESDFVRKIDQSIINSGVLAPGLFNFRENLSGVMTHVAKDEEDASSFMRTKSRPGLDDWVYVLEDSDGLAVMTKFAQFLKSFDLFYQFLPGHIYVVSAELELEIIAKTPLWLSVRSQNR